MPLYLVLEDGGDAHLGIEEESVGRHQVGPPVRERSARAQMQGQVGHPIRGHEQEPSPAEVLQIGLTGVVVHKGGPMGKAHGLNGVTVSRHDPPEEQGHEVAVANEDNGPPAWRGALSLRRHAGVEDVRGRGLGEHGVEVLREPDVESRGPLLGLGPCLRSSPARVPAHGAPPEALEGCADGRVRRVGTGRTFVCEGRGEEAPDLLGGHAGLGHVLEVAALGLEVGGVYQDGGRQAFLAFPSAASSAPQPPEGGQQCREGAAHGADDDPQRGAGRAAQFLDQLLRQTLGLRDSDGRKARVGVPARVDVGGPTL